MGQLEGCFRTEGARIGDFVAVVHYGDPNNPKEVHVLLLGTL